MSAISSVNYANIESEVLVQEDEKKVSAAQVGQLMTNLQAMLSSLTDQMVHAMESTSGTSESSTSTDTDTDTPSATTTDTTVATETDETDTTSSSKSDEETTSSSGMTQTQQMAFAIGEGMVQSVTGVCSTACDNQSEQSGEGSI